MSISRATPPPTNRPANLPPDLLRELASRERLFLCLDYDGTLSQITARPNEARPAPLAPGM